MATINRCQRPATSHLAIVSVVRELGADINLHKSLMLAAGGLVSVEHCAGCVSGKRCDDRDCTTSRASFHGGFRNRVNEDIRTRSAETVKKRIAADIDDGSPAAYFHAFANQANPDKGMSGVIEYGTPVRFAVCKEASGVRQLTSIIDPVI
jgi:hypothetical protein